MASPATQPSASPAVKSPGISAADATALTQKVQELEAKVSTLEAREQEHERQLQQQEQQQIDRKDFAAAIAETIAQADATEKQLQVQPIPAGYDPSVGFVIRSDDGNFVLHPGLIVDFRNDTSYREHIPPTVAAGGSALVTRSGYDTENGFDVTRLRFTVDGNASHNVSYFVQVQDDQGAGVGLLDAFATLRLGDDSPFYLRAGQFKDPIWHERNLSEARLMAVDRSLAEDLLGGGQGSRIQGVAAIYDQDRFRGQVDFHDGYNSLNTAFYDAGGNGAGVGGESGVTPDNFGASTRLEYLIIGKRSDGIDSFHDYDRGFTALGDKHDLLVLGGGVDYTQAGGNYDIIHSADIQYDSTSGLSAFGAYYGTYRYLQFNQGVVPGSYYDPGFEAQVAYLVTSKIEPFARYDYAYLEQPTRVGAPVGEAQEFTVGANYYLYKQNVKFTLDASWLPDGSPVDASALGILKDSGHNEWLVRAQFQIAL